MASSRGTRFGLGLSALLADPEDPRPGGFCRDEILFFPLDLAGEMLTADFELREVLSSDLPMASGSEDDMGDLVVIAKRGCGGPLAPRVAVDLLRMWGRCPKVATIAASMSDLSLPGAAMLVPDPYPERRFPDGNRSPLGGVHVMTARGISAAVLAHGFRGGEVDEARAMLRFCAVHRFVVTATAA